ncbi:ATP-binding cassette domain-containing protein [Mycobacterium antarcticum]|uniref:ATP-binding cassette domain-containing protein n=1 Tax=Mycolicibacterium sp. TUM20984 TaxID=3023368 RepID=UPI0032E9DDAB
MRPGKSRLLKCIAGIHRCVRALQLTGTDAGLATASRGRRGDWASVGYRFLYTRRILRHWCPSASLRPSCWAARAAPRSAQRVDLDEVAQVLVDLCPDDLSTRAISDLSGGQRQLVSIAQAVIRKPAVMLLDEPTSSLDLRNQLQLLELVRRLAESQPAIVLITVHDLGSAVRRTTSSSFTTEPYIPRARHSPRSLGRCCGRSTGSTPSCIRHPRASSAWQPPGACDPR